MSINEVRIETSKQTKSANEMRSKSYKKKLKFRSDYIDPSYGEKSQIPDMTDDQFEEEKKLFH